MSETPPRSLWSSPVVGVTALILALAALVAGLGFAWIGYDRMAQLEVQLARRIGEFDAASREARVAAKAANDALADLQSRLMALENRAQETQDQQLALTAMYQDLARSQDERVIADLEQTLLLAQQQLQLAGNVRAALIALEAAETRLAQLGKPQFAALRAAIARDLERLKLLPAADIEGIGARLEALMQNVDQLKSESETEPPAQAVAAPKPGPADTLARLSREIWEEFKSLVRIRRLDHPDLPLLTPSQTYFLRENLKLRLLAARLALLQRDEAGFRADLGAARGWIERYFNRQDAGGKAFAASLDELLRAPVALKDAGIDASLQALRAARKGP
ncbi:MAG: uroporphyrinogen-III C-methyltransferase [Hydrogenophilales bacterium]|nr:uroporphyrinogen-III C-methyltransferase [Hydrogenophilales bacterium]